jgi:hypothetical protein
MLLKAMVVGNVNWEGRGVFSCGHRGQVRYAPRIIYFLYYGKIDNTLGVLHSCDNPVCVNPKHLMQDTQRENLLQAYRRGRKTNSGEQNPRAILTKEKVILIREQLKTGKSRATVAREFNVSSGAIAGIKHGRTWKTT